MICATTRYSLSILLLLFSFTQQAFSQDPNGFDYGYKVHARSHSPALALVPSLGYGYNFWGDSETVLYGYLRPSISPILTPSLVGVESELSIFPISFFGVSLGQTKLYRFLDPAGQDCDLAECQGTLESDYVITRLLLAYRNFFVSAALKRVFHETKADQSLGQLEPNYSLLLSGGKQQIETLNLATGYRLNEKSAAGVLIQRAQLSGSGATQEADYLFFQSSLEDYGYPNFKLTLGVGRYLSELQNEGLSLLSSLEFTGKKSLNLY